MCNTLINVQEFTELFADCDEYMTERMGEFLVWRADHPTLGQIVGVQGEGTRILTFTEKHLIQEAL